VTEGSDIALVYYTGYGIAVNGTNYLVPVDASLRSEIDVEGETISVDRLLWALQPKRLKLIILDACRDNPFTKTMTRPLQTRVAVGMARGESIGADSLVAFSAKPGTLAYDGAGTHSPYATALLKNLSTPGLDVRIALGRIRDEVLADTGARQEPFVEGSLGGATVTLVPVAGAPPSSSTAASVVVAAVEAARAKVVATERKPEEAKQKAEKGRRGEGGSGSRRACRG
jgi:uncharacterized caspase-like protein